MRNEHDNSATKTAVMTEQAKASSSSSRTMPFSDDNNGSVYQQTTDLIPREFSTSVQENPEVGNHKSRFTTGESSRRPTEDPRLPHQSSSFLERSGRSQTSVLGNKQNPDIVGNGKNPRTDLSILDPNHMDYPYFDANKHLELHDSYINPEQDTAVPSWSLNAHLDAGSSAFSGPSGTAPITDSRVLKPAPSLEPPIEMEQGRPYAGYPAAEHSTRQAPTEFNSTEHSVPYSRYHYTPSSAAASPNYVRSELSEESASPGLGSSMSSNNTSSSDDEYDEYISALNLAFQRGQNAADDDDNDNESRLFKDCNPSTFEIYRSVQGHKAPADDIYDTKKFYLADDSYIIDETEHLPPQELDDIDFQDFYEESNSHDLPHVAGPLLQPLNANHIFPEDDDIYDDEDIDHDQESDFVGFTMHTDSMDPHFLNCVNPSIPEEVNSLAEAQQAVLNAVYGSQDSNGRPGPMPGPEVQETGRDPITVDPPPNLRSQSVQEVLNCTSVESGVRRGMFVIPRIGKSIYVDGSTIAILEGTRPVKVFPRTPETAKFLQNFLLNKPFPWTFILDPVESVGDQPVASSASTPAVAPTLLTDQEYNDLHRDTEYSFFYVEPSLILEHFPPHIAKPLLASPLAPKEGNTYINADGDVEAAYESNLTVEQFIKQWLLRSQIPHTALSMPQPFIPISSEAANVLDWTRPDKISRPERCREDVYDIQQIPWEQKLRVSRSDARSLRDQLYTAYRNLDHDPHWVCV